MPRLLFALVNAIMVSGCDSRVGDSRVPQLEMQMEELKSEMAELKERVDRVERSQSMSDLDQNIRTVAYLTPGADGYSVVEFDLGRLTVSLDDIKAYANGSRITLRFGNLTSATIRDLGATLEWGRVDQKGVPDNKSAKSREVTFMKELQPGAWTKVQIVLDGVPPEAFGFVRVRAITHKSITLYQR